MKLIDLSGMKYGKWLVIEYIKNEKGILWRCKCDCGNEKFVNGTSLRKGQSKSCGNCSRGKDLIGKEFGRLLVLEKHAIKDKYNYNRWLCKCNCGNETLVSTHSLTTGNTKSCGCLFKESISKEFGESAFNSLYSTYKRVARKKNLIFKIDIKQFKKIVKKDCFYCGIKPYRKKINNYNNGDFIYNGIDRIDNNKGYTIGNIVTCCKECNIAKNNSTQKEFFIWIERVYNNNIRSN